MRGQLIMFGLSHDSSQDPCRLRLALIHLFFGNLNDRRMGGLLPRLASS